MPVAYYKIAGHEFGPEDGDTPTPREFDFAITCGSTQDGAVGYHLMEEGEGSFGTASKTDYGLLTLTQLRTLNGSLRLRFHGGLTPFKTIFLVINAGGVAESATLTVDKHGRYNSETSDFGQLFSDSMEVKAGVANTVKARKKRSTK